MWQLLHLQDTQLVQMCMQEIDWACTASLRQGLLDNAPRHIQASPWHDQKTCAQGASGQSHEHNGAQQRLSSIFRYTDHIISTTGEI